MISNMLDDPTTPEEVKPCVLLTTHSMEECEVSVDTSRFKTKIAAVAALTVPFLWILGDKGSLL